MQLNTQTRLLLVNVNLVVMCVVARYVASVYVQGNMFSKCAFASRSVSCILLMNRQFWINSRVITAHACVGFNVPLDELKLRDYWVYYVAKCPGYNCYIVLDVWYSLPYIGTGFHCCRFFIRANKKALRKSV